MRNEAKAILSFQAPIFPIALLDLAENFYGCRKLNKAALYQRCKISQAQISRTESTISGWQMREILRSCRDIARPGIPLSIQLADYIPITVPGGMFGLASFTAKDIAQALEVMVDFAHTVMPAYHFERLNVGSQCHIILRPTMDFGDVQFLLDEAVCGYFLNLRHFAQFSEPSIQVHLSHEPLGEIEAYNTYFKAKYSFSKKTIEVIFEKHHLSQALYTHNLATFNEVYSSLKNTSNSAANLSISYKVKKKLQQRLANKLSTSICQVAEQMNISERTLARRLHSENISFAEIKQQVSVDYAKLLLEDTAYPICKIAHICGYNSDSNFSRAFKSSTGQTPKQFRSAQ
jgi:AraC-like DNA-binding protein